MEVISMIIVAVDVDKDKHNCFITNTDDEVLFNPFIITNSQNGFEDLSVRPADLDIRENVETRFPLSSLCIVNSTKYICIWNPTFRAYLAKKRAEGKHYNVAISHAAKKLVRLIYHLETTGETYLSKAS